MPPGASQPTVIACPRCHASYFPNGDFLADGTYQSACRSCGHRFKFRSVVQPRATITITVNGKQYTVDGNYDSSMSLNTFIRDVAGLKGTKYMCFEGGCGSCVVAASLYDPVTTSDITVAIVSCLCPVWICDGWEITTTEGIGSARQGYHEVQSRLAENSGSQCGWCSSGMVMNMYSLLQEHPVPTKQKVEDSFDGNLCRCTGYRPILDAMKSFAIDRSSCDIEDVGKICCKKGGQGCHVKSPKLSQHEPLYMVLRNGAQWMRPGSLPELYQLLDIYKDDNYMLVFGNTSTGVRRTSADVFIDMRGVPELYVYMLSDAVEFGANITLTQLAELLEQASTSVPSYSYCANHAAHVRKIAGTPIRNAGCWAGNLMIKHAQKDFPSDVFMILETVNAQITVGSSTGTSTYSPLELLSVDMKGQAIIKLTLPSLTAMDVVRTFKIMPRSQNSLAMVNAGFNMRLDPYDNYRVLQQPSIVFGGMGELQNHAPATETYLIDKQLGEPSVLAGALETLKEELVANDDPSLTSAAYRKDLAVSLFYKYVLAALSDIVGDRFKSGGEELHRPLSEGVQDFDTDPSKYPLTEPMPKRAAKAQTAGEAQYINDIPAVPGQLYGLFVLSTVGNATIAEIDASDALLIPGVVDFVTATDIPPGGTNSFMPPPFEPEPIFAESQVEYCGQALGLILAESQGLAFAGVRAVRVTYTDIQPPLTDIEEAVDQESFFPKPGPDLIAGDAEGAIADSPHVIEGEVVLGTQAHLNMETHTAICTPHDEGMEVLATTQWVDNCQMAVAKVLGIRISQIQMKVKRLGGAYGAKISRTNQIATACALAAYKQNKPVRLMTPFSTQMEMVGKRFPYLAKYQVGVNSDGKLNGLKVNVFTDCGHSPNDNAVNGAVMYMDNAYFCENWHVIPAAVKTNLPGNTWCRSPGTLPGIYIMEYMMEHVAKELDLDPFEVKKLNYYQDGQSTPYGQILENVNIGEMTTQLEASADITNRKEEIQAFNEANRWKKRALSVSPVKWGVPLGPGLPFNVYMAVYHGDGSVAIAHGGVECGQGINVKVLQVVAHELDIPMDMIYVRPVEDFANANTDATGGSTTFEMCCQGVIDCCKQIKERLEPYSPGNTWAQQVQAAFRDGVSLTAKYWVYGNPSVIFPYFAYGVTCMEVELDVLTGQCQIPRCDIIYDAGESPNPAVDIGQIEGSVVMGIGYSMYEKTRYHPTTGKNLSNGTFEYKPPTTKDIPVDFRVSLLKDTPSPIGVLGSKVVGEPPMCGSCSAWFAVKHCAEAARKETEQYNYFQMDCPATVEDAQLACLNDTADYVLQ